MKRYFKFRKDFRCNWYNILGAYDTQNLDKQVVENEYNKFIKKCNWYRTKSKLIKTDKYYADIFVFESEGITQEYVDDLNETLSGSVYLVKKEDEFDTIEELCDYVLYYNFENELVIRKCKDVNFVSLKSNLKSGYIKDVKSAILTDKGIIYVAKMKGVLPNGEIDWELL